MNREIKTYYTGDLEVFAVQGHDPYGPHVVLLHGFGANAHDLLSLSEMVNAPSNTTWLFPNAPHLVPFSESYIGRSWFSFDMAKLENAMRASRYDELAVGVPPDLSYASDLIIKLLKKIPVSPGNIVIGGFSQGAMLATDVALKMQENLAGLAILSGSVINEAEWKSHALRHKGLHFFQSHGDEDTILSIDLAKRLESLFKDSGLLGALQVFQDGHTIPEEVLTSFGEFLSKQLNL
ncbi:MAG: dienelactone hydrolase family protein [Chlamydiales bacterium]|nr:dienelactone hydrolase family protein [Chlamydiales bacterium]